MLIFKCVDYKQGNYFGTMLVAMGKADCLLGNATKRLQNMMLDFPVDGDMQFDADINPSVGQLKFSGSKVAGYANTFIFLDITSGNIGYKIAQRTGNFDAYGPIPLGLNALHQRPVPGLQRPGSVLHGHYYRCIGRLI